jgi:hypothetical protein
MGKKILNEARKINENGLGVVVHFDHKPSDDMTLSLKSGTIPGYGILK